MENTEKEQGQDLMEQMKEMMQAMLQGQQAQQAMQPKMQQVNPFAALTGIKSVEYEIKEVSLELYMKGESGNLKGHITLTGINDNASLINAIVDLVNNKGFALNIFKSNKSNQKASF